MIWRVNVRVVEVHGGGVVRPPVLSWSYFGALGVNWVFSVLLCGKRSRATLVVIWSPQGGLVWEICGKSAGGSGQVVSGAFLVVFWSVRRQLGF